MVFVPSRIHPDNFVFEKRYLRDRDLPTDSEGDRGKYNGGIYFPVCSNQIILVYSLLFTNLKLTTQLEPLKN